MNESALNERWSGYLDWHRSQEKREAFEWRKWDGSPEHSTAINDAQIERAQQAMTRLGIPHDWRPLYIRQAPRNA